jgi:hypothetical protein
MTTTATRTLPVQFASPCMHPEHPVGTYFVQCGGGTGDNNDDSATAATPYSLQVLSVLPNALSLLPSALKVGLISLL